MFARAVRITRVGGIEVRLDPSLLLFVVLVVWTFTGRFAPAHGLPTAIGMATAGTLLFFGSILAHELAHAFEGRHRRLEVHGVTLFLFGGVTEMHAHDQTPRDELSIAAVGPYVSLFCAAVFGLVATFASSVLPAAVAGPVAEVAGLLGWLNLILAVFNVVPGAPLDGGRMLRAVLWMLLKDRNRALRISARTGQALGLALVGASLWLGFRGPQVGGVGSPPASQLLVPTIIGVMIGFFLFQAARSELRTAEVDRLFTDRTVRSLVGALPDPVPADHLLDVVDLHARSHGSELLPVVDDDTMIGLLDVREMEGLHPTDRSVRTAGELAGPIVGLPSVELDDDLHELVERFQGEHDVVVLTDAGRPVAVVTQREIAQAITHLKASGTSGRPQAAGHLPPGPDAEVNP
jgi:Zn-dependent protease/predicted transcriptional regulator